jgi:alkaline phosphatase D
LVLSVATAGSVLGTSACGDSESQAESGASPFFPQSVASFDPRPTSVVLWVRVQDPLRKEEDLEVVLEIAKDAAFAALVSLGAGPSLTLHAEAAWDHTLRARIDALEPGTTYYYRFTYENAGRKVRSRVGRTRTAPDENADVPLRFAVISCQDYGTGYFHVHRRLVEEELDFVLHLGDYVYETTGAAAATGPRSVTFGHPEAALALGDKGLAARSLDNYRDLYRTARADPDLQALHERFPMLAIWDDHEFSDDCYGATANYFDGRRDETDLERRAAADQAWFEYMGLDFSSPPTSSWDANAPFPDNLAIYREFAFGRHLALVLTDLRRYRPDHLVPENALPGRIFAVESEIEGVDRAALVPYVDVDRFEDGAYRALLRGAAESLELDADSIQGNLSVPWLNSLLPRVVADDALPAIDDSADLPRGYAYHQLLKTEQFSLVGARYLVAEAPFSALARARYETTDGAAQRLMGEAQREWFLAALRRSERTFKVWGSEVAFMPRRLDLTNSPTLPDTLQTKLLISAEDWDGMPDERRALLEALSELDNFVVLSGDLHCFLAGTPFVPGAPERRVIEFLTSSVSSSTWRDVLLSTIATDPRLPKGAAFLVAGVGSLLQDPESKPNPHLAYQDLGRNGCSLISVDAEAFEVEFLAIDPKDLRLAAGSFAGGLAARFSSERFRVRAGTKALEREIDGKFASWDVEAAAWSST